MEEEEDYSNGATATATSNNKNRKISPLADSDTDIGSDFAFFDELTDDLVLEIISKLGSTASCPAHFFNLLLTSKRMNELGFHRTVLKNVSPKVFTSRAQNWEVDALEFIKKCVEAMNVEAIYTLGMIGFYLLENREAMKGLIESAALLKHPAAHHALAVIQNNGSGGTEDDVDPVSAVGNALTAAFLGHADAAREMGLLFLDGHCVERDVEEGRRLILQANTREIISVLPPGAIGGAGSSRIPLPVPRTGLATGRWLTWVPRGPKLLGLVSESDLTFESNFGWNVPEPEPHPANCFLTEWFEIRGWDPGNGLRVCCREGCGRPETRMDEFLMCRFCEDDCYCSRACQMIDWKRRHHLVCNGEYDHEEEYYEEDIVVNGIQEEEVDNEGDLQE